MKYNLQIIIDGGIIDYSKKEENMFKMEQHGTIVKICNNDGRFVDMDFASEDNAIWFVKTNRLNSKLDLVFDAALARENMQEVVEPGVNLADIVNMCGDIPVYLLMRTVAQCMQPLSNRHVQCIKDFVSSHPDSCFVDLRTFDNTLSEIYVLLHTHVGQDVVQGILSKFNTLSAQSAIVNFLFSVYESKKYQMLSQSRTSLTTAEATFRTAYYLMNDNKYINISLYFLMETLEIANIDYTYNNTTNAEKIMEQVNPMLYKKAADFCKDLENSSSKTVLLFCRMIAPQLFNDGLPDTLAIEYYLD